MYNKNLVERKCDCCGKIFEGIGNLKYCTSCRKKGTGENAICKVCGEKFQRNAEFHIYCSEECRYKAKHYHRKKTRSWYVS